MYDLFEYNNSCAGDFVCTECGDKIDGLQTKSFGCDMARIRMNDDGTLESKSELYEDEDGPHQRWRIIKDTTYARVYSSCRKDGRWHEWRIHVREGVVKEIARVDTSG